jgi:mannose-6-phosphate isomerase-like protein (cupin superfamily)
MAIPTVRPTRDEMLKCVARFKDLRGTSSGLPDMEIDGYRRALFNVVGHHAPAAAEEDPDVYSPLGDQARPHIHHLSPGFGLAFCKARPGNGVMMHNHDTNETFVVLEGTWRMTWQGDAGDDHVDLEQYDLISFPPHVQRQFTCIRAPEGKEEGVMFGIVGGDHPMVEFSPEAQEIFRRQAADAAAAG